LPFNLPQAKPPPRDRALRLSRSALLDALFTCFSSHPYWSLKALKEKTNQPETWLKEVLSEVGVLQKRGPYVGLWSLMENYRKGLDGAGEGDEGAGEGSGGVKGEEGQGQGVGGVKGEEGEEEFGSGAEDEGSDDEDMEEI
jgi:transcription initiation factor TFIIF subunit beta